MKKILTLFYLCPLFLSAQLQNLDFEDWQTDTQLNYWQCGVIFGENDSFSEHFYFGNNADAHHNNYALTLGMWYFYVKDAAIQRAPINYLPEKLRGYYKYTENLLEKEGEYVVDTAQVNVFLTKWDPAISQRDTIGIGELKLGEEQLNYQLFEVAIEYDDITQEPDSIAVILDPSLINRKGSIIGGVGSGWQADISGDGSSSFFTIDYLSLEGNVLTNTSYEKSQIVMYPNPSSEEIFISTYSGEIAIYDILGKKVLAKTITENQAINIATLSKGVYFLKLAGQNSIVRKFIKK